jgi:hypothetical protein
MEVIAKSSMVAAIIPKDRFQHGNRNAISMEKGLGFGG